VATGQVIPPPLPWENCPFRRAVLIFVLYLFLCSVTKPQIFFWFPALTSVCRAIEGMRYNDLIVCLY
jgi:hypothetical protein